MPGLNDVDIRQSPLWDHMVKVLSHIVSERPADPLEAMGPTSHKVLSGSAVPPKTASRLFAEVRPAAHTDVPADALVNTRWAANMTRSLVPPPAARRPRNGELPDEDDEYAVEAAMDDPFLNPAAAPSVVQQQLAQTEAEGLTGSISDVVAEQRVFNVMGVGLPEEESFRLLVGLKHVMKTEPLASVRFWGKIIGVRADYYIAEATIDPSRLPEDADGDFADEDEYGDEEDGLPLWRVAAALGANTAKRHHSTPKEEPNTGLNERVYFAAPTTDPTTWTRLPDVAPQHIVIARKIRCAFTGDLEAPVHSHPRFPGVEKHYLRAQLARITSACSVAPKDVYMTEGALPEEEEDDDGNLLPLPAMVPAYAAVPPLIPQETPDEEDTEAIQLVQAWYHGYAHEELLQGKHWVHTAATVLECGRATVAPPREPDEGDDELDAQEPQDEDNEDGRFNREELINPFLSDLSKDAQLAFPGHSRKHFSAWNFRQAFRSESSNTSTYLARSALWPGAFTHAVTTRGQPGAQHQMLYIGNGLKTLQGAVFAPELPPRRMVEFSEEGLVLQRDCTVDEELTYVPAPVVQEDEEDEEQLEDDGGY